MRIFAFFCLIFAVFGLFTACEDLNKPSNYAVNFEANDGIPAPDGQTIARGGRVAEPAAMTKTGYGFGGWYKEENFANIWDFTIDTVIDNITLYAKWDTNFHTVSFEANGGPPVQQQNIAHGGKVVLPAAIGKVGFTFSGWYKDENFATIWDFTTDIVTNNITLYAKWDTIAGNTYYTVNFDADGGTPAPQNQTVVQGGQVTQPVEMTKDGYTFGGWYEDAFTNQWDFSSDVVTDDITLYAKWLENFIVTFEANGGNPAPVQQIVGNGRKASEPPTMINDDLYLEGWYKDEECVNLWNFNSNVITGDITLYAKWVNAVFVTGASWTMKMRWLNENVQSDTDYIIEFDADESIAQITFSFNGKTNVRITLKGIGAKRIVSLSSGGSMFTVGSGVTLILDNNLELQGRNNNSAPLVNVNTGGNLILNNGARITSNSLSSYYSSSGGGVSISGTFTMNGGEISGNTGRGGVYVSNGTFTMNGGEISGNTDSGGVHLDRGTVTMNGGKISGNTGGGVYLVSGSASNGTFTMNGGKISDNTTAYNGGGVCVGSYFSMVGTFIMNGGEISGNTAPGSGGGVYSSGIFTMNGGEISGNIASDSGGGVYNSGTFTMDGGEISGNTTSSSGGGVYSRGSIFNKTDGTIFGYSDGDSNSNVVKNRYGVVQQNKGHAVYIYSSNSIYNGMGKDTTSGLGDNLYFDGRTNPPASSGEWDY